MTTKIAIILAVILFILIGVAAWFISYYPALSINNGPEEITEGATPNPSVNEYDLITPSPFGPDAISAIKAYAAQQFNVDESALVVVSSTKQSWKSTCFDLDIQDDSCKQEPTSGYQVILKINGQNVTYRANDAGNFVRIVKN